jgi:hypothetical protein
VPDVPGARPVIVDGVRERVSQVSVHELDHSEAHEHENGGQVEVIRRKDAQEPAVVELSQGQCAGSAELTEQQARDQKS